MTAEWINRVHFGDCLDTLRRMPDGIVQTCVTSPPYYEPLQRERLIGQTLGLELA